MPRVSKRVPLHRTSYGRGHIFHLLTGCDFFGDGFGSDVAAMREAWALPDVRERVYALLEARRARMDGRAQPWAAVRFK